MVKKLTVFVLVILASLSATAASSRGLYISHSNTSEAGYFAFFSTASLVDLHETELSVGCSTEHRLTIYGTVSAQLGSEVCSFTRFAGLSSVAGIGAGAGLTYNTRLLAVRADARLEILLFDRDISNLYSMLALKICPTAVVFSKQTGKGNLSLSAGLPLSVWIGSCGRFYGAGLVFCLDYCGGLAE